MKPLGIESATSVTMVNGSILRYTLIACLLINKSIWSY